MRKKEGGREKNIETFLQFVESRGSLTGGWGGGFCKIGFESREQSKIRIYEACRVIKHRPVATLQLVNSHRHQPWAYSTFKFLSSWNSPRPTWLYSGLFAVRKFRSTRICLDWREARTNWKVQIALLRFEMFIGIIYHVHREFLVWRFCSQFCLFLFCPIFDI